MIPWRELDRAEIPGETHPLLLMRRGEEFTIRIGPHALMGSTAHGSEELLAELACQQLVQTRMCSGHTGTDVPPAQKLAPVCGAGEGSTSLESAVSVLVGGLGMGYTLAAALRSLPGNAEITVAELIPAVVAWNQGLLAAQAGEPLSDPRASVWIGDVGRLIRDAPSSSYDAILLDVDNGPDGLTRAGNRWLYDMAGLEAIQLALRPGGILGVWSVAPDAVFTQRLQSSGFSVDERRVRARKTKGGRHTLWLATRAGRSTAHP